MADPTEVDDILDGTPGNDTIDALGGNDTITSGGGLDNLQGGAGDDTIVLDAPVTSGSQFDGGTENDTLKILPGAMTATANGPFATLVSVATKNFETIQLGTQAGEVVRAIMHTGQLGGVTTIKGGAGVDVFIVVTGVPGTYSLQPLTLADWTEGTDFFLFTADPAATGSYTLNVGLHNGTYNVGGGAGNDTLNGSDGVEILSGNAGNDTINAAGGDDTLNGGDGDDVLNGGAGNDRLSGGGGLNKLSGGTGNDTLVVDAAFAGGSVFDGGADTDTLELHNLAGAQVVTGSQFPAGLPTTEVGFFSAALNSIERVDFKSTAGTGLTGQFLFGGSFPNQVGSGLSATAELVGGAGTDTLMLLAQTAAGNPTATFTVPTFTYTGWNTPDRAYQDGDRVLFFALGDGNITLNGSAHAGVQLLIAGAGDDTVNGSNDMDLIAGGAGENELYGNGGNDALLAVNVVPNDDKGVTGTEGTNTFANNKFDGGTGTDFLVAGGNVDFQGTLESIEGIYLSPAYTNKLASNASQLPTVLTMSGATMATLPSNLILDGTGSIVVNLAPGETFNGAGYTFDAGSNVTFTVNGSTDGDTIAGTSGDDTLIGGEGDDTIHSGGGKDAIDGGAGNDTIVLDGLVAAGSKYDGGADDDRLTVTVAAGAILNGSANVHLTGTALSGFEGIKFDSQVSTGVNAVIGSWQLAGITSLTGGDGADQLVVIAPSAGTYTLPAFTLNDWTDGKDNVLLYVSDSASGNFTLNAANHAGKAILVAQGGNDTLNGSDGTEDLYGNAGVDAIKGGGGNDRLFGGDGNDTLNGGLGDDSIDGGNNTDTVTYADAAGSVTVDLGTATPQDTGAAGLDTIVNVENLTGSAFADTLTGNAGNNVLNGLAGDDRINGKGGNDNIDAGAGNDTVVFDTAQSGIFDPVNGGDDHDILRLVGRDGPALTPYATSSSYYILFGARNFEEATFESSAGTSLGLILSYQSGGTAIAPPTTLNGNAGSDILTLFVTDGMGSSTQFLMPEITANGWMSAAKTYRALDGGDAIGMLAGDPQNYTLRANDANGLAGLIQTLNGGAGNDTLHGSVGRDLLDGGAGTNVLNGNDGDDALVIFNSASDGVTFTNYTGLGSSFNGGIGNDFLSVGGAVNFLGTLSGIEGIFLQSAWTNSSNGSVQAAAALTIGGANMASIGPNAVLDGTGTIIVNLASGDTFNGADYIFEAGSNVTFAINGSTGDDTIIGTANADTLSGDDGDDTLTGGGGADLFELSLGNDVVDDFTRGSDRIDLREVGISSFAQLQPYMSQNGLDATFSLLYDGAVNTISLKDIANSSLTEDDFVFASPTDPHNLTGMDNADTLFGASGNDTLSGLGGNDIIHAGGGKDTISGGDGDDTIVLNAPVAVGSIIDGGDGTDTLELHNLADAPVSFSRLATAGIATTGYGLAGIPGVPTTVSSIERIDFQSGAGTAISTTLAFGGANPVNQASSLTHVVGGAGLDILVLSAGAGTAGANTSITAPVLTYDNWTSVARAYQQGDRVIVLANGAGDVVLTGTSHDGIQDLVGGNGNDTLNGSNGMDYLSGGLGANQLYGNDGDDTLAIVNNIPNGSDGNPSGGESTLTGAGSKFDGGAGTDFLAVGGNVNFQGTLQDIEGIYLFPSYTSTIAFNASQLPTVLTIDSAKWAALPSGLVLDGIGSVIVNLASGDSFNGSAYTFDSGSDVTFTVNGSTGNDTMTGTVNSDILNGGNGDDTMNGGAGDDVVDGGDGADTAVLSGALADYSLAQQGDGSVIVTDLRGGSPDGADRFRNVESLQFSDTTATFKALLNIAPVIGSNGGGDTAAVSIFENATTVTTVQATDPDSSPLTYAIAGGADAALFQIDSATGALSFKAAPNFESPIDAGADNVYDVIVSASDGAKNDTQAIAVTIGNVVEGQTRSLTTGADTFAAPSEDNWTIDGLAGNDLITTRGGTDTVRGNAGDDTIATGDGDDSVTFSGNGDGFDSIDGGGGTDAITALSKNTVIGLRSVAGVETISANGFAGVTILGSSGADTLDLGSVTLNGITLIDGGAGDDIITGSEADDVIYGNAGSNTIKAGGGNDTIRFGIGSTDTVDGGDGADTLIAIANNASIDWSKVSNVEAVSGGSFSGVSIVGTAGNETFDFSGIALTGIALIDGGAGDDTITGTAGSDTIYGNAGVNTIDAGGGNDTIRFGAGSTDKINGGSGTDTLTATVNNASIAWAFVSEVEAVTAGTFTGVRIAGTDGNDIMNLNTVALTKIAAIDGGLGDDDITGSTGADTILGSAGADTFHAASGGNDIIDGGADSDTVSYDLSKAGVTISLAVAGSQKNGNGTDTIANVENLTGSAFADKLTGNGGANELRGEAGNDILTGGGGADSLFGGTGADTFNFAGIGDSTAAARDTIRDFDRAEGDKIDLRLIDPIPGGKDNAFKWGGTTATANGIWHRSDASGTTVFGDTDGNLATIEFTLFLENTSSVLQTDFLF